MYLLHIVHVVQSFPFIDLLSPHIPLSPTALPIHHLRLLLRKALPYALAPGHEFLYAPTDTALLAGDQRFRREVVDAVVEAAVYEGGKHSHEFLHLFPFHALLELSLLSSCQAHSVHLD